MFYAGGMDTGHDGVEFGINFAGDPVAVSGILAHLKTAGGNTAGVDSFTGSKDYSVLAECGDRLRSTSHIGNFCNDTDIVFDEHCGIIAVKFILNGAGHGDISRDFPDLASGDKFGTGELFGIRSDDILTAGTQFKHIGDLFFIHSGFIQNIAVRTGNGDHFGSEFRGFECSTPSNIAESGNHNAFTGNGVIEFLKHMLNKIDRSESGRFGPDQRTAPAHAFTGQNTAVIVGKTAVGPEKISDFPGTDTEISGGHVNLSSDMTVKFPHERVAEVHDLKLGFSFGIEIAAAFAAAHGQRGQSIFEGLFKTEKFQSGQSH